MVERKVGCVSCLFQAPSARRSAGFRLKFQTCGWALGAWLSLELNGLGLLSSGGSFYKVYVILLQKSRFIKCESFYYKTVIS